MDSSPSGLHRREFPSRNGAIRVPIVALAALPIALAATAAAGAQGLPRLTVTAFALSADTTEPRVGSRFHVIVTLHVVQEVAQVETISDTLQLPDLAALEILGDERGLSTGPQGSVYRESVVVEAQSSGRLTIDPARFEAIDARDGKAKEWSTNALVLHVLGTPGQELERAAALAARIAIAIVVALVVLASLLLVAARRTPPAAAHDPPPEPPREPTERERLLEALALLRAEPARSGAMQARAVLHRMVGASHGETLDDVMLRAQQTHPGLLQVLPAIERAAFTYEEDLRDAVAAAIAVLERSVQ